MTRDELILGCFYWVAYGPPEKRTVTLAQWDCYANPRGHWWLVGSGLSHPYTSCLALEGPLKAPSLAQEPSNGRK